MTVTRIRTTLRDHTDQCFSGFNSVHITDFPYYLNPGDAAIWLGSLKALKCAGVATVSSSHTPTIPPGVDAIAIQGGGNFGDLWPDHTRLREEIIAHNPQVPIIQLPASLEISDRGQLGTLQRLVTRHGRCTFMWRDQRSITDAHDIFPTSEHRLVPDAAIHLEPTPQPRRSEHILLIDRQDREAPLEAQFPDAIDWAYPWWFKIRSGWWPSRGLDLLGLTCHHQHVYRLLAREQLQYAYRLLGGSSAVVTNRLHAFILSTIVGLPAVLYPERFGKNRAFIETWFRHERHQVWAENRQEALSLATTQAVRPPCV